MGARELLNQATRSGLTLVVDGPSLVVRPKERLTNSMRSALMAAKPELLALLRESGQRCQEGQEGQGFQVDRRGPLAGTWTDVDIARFVSRRDRLVRWGWPELDAEALAERLTLRDREGDDRSTCAGDCAHYRPGRCSNHHRAGLCSAAIGVDLAGTFQRCPGFKPAWTTHALNRTESHHPEDRPYAP